MTMVAERLAESLRVLVDARLDTLDRMLLGRVPRADRLAIVSEVETQIHDQLEARGTGDPTREDVLAVLARLDPPEAYLPEEDEPFTPPRAVAARLASPPGANATTVADPRRRAAFVGGVLGIVTLVLVLMTPFFFYGSMLLAELVESAALWYALLIAGVLAIGSSGVVAIVLACRGWGRSGWSVCGLVTGIASLMLLFALAVATLFLVLNN